MSGSSQPCHCEPKICTQLLLEGVFEIPCQKPDIERALNVTSKPVITSVKVICDKVIFTGFFEICLEYVGCVPGSSQPMHFAEYRKPFAGFLDCEGAQPGMKAILEPFIEFQEYCITSDRRLSFLVVLKICIVKLEPMPCESHDEHGMCSSQPIPVEDCRCSHQYEPECPPQTRRPHYDCNPYPKYKPQHECKQISEPNYGYQPCSHRHECYKPHCPQKFYHGS